MKLEQTEYIKIQKFKSIRNLILRKFHVFNICLYFQIIIRNQRPKHRTTMKSDCMKIQFILILLFFLTLSDFFLTLSDFIGTIFI